jgi:hypothetical protein
MPRLVRGISHREDSRKDSPDKPGHDGVVTRLLLAHLQRDEAQPALAFDE